MIRVPINEEEFILFRRGKKGFLSLILLMIITISVTACSKGEDGVIAKVNGKDISLEEFNKEFDIIKKARQKEHNDEDILEKDIDGERYGDILKEQIFNMLVDEEIIAQDLEKLEIGVTDDEVEEQLQSFKSSYIEQLGSEEEYKEFLEENGFTEEYLKVDIRRQLMVQKHRDDFLNKVHLKDEEIEKYYEDNKDGLTKLRLSHILAEDEEKGKAILEKLKKDGADFHAIAATDSVDPQTSEKGGDLGFVRKGDLQSKGLGELEEPAFALKAGENSDLVETGLGLHILYVEERLETLDELKDDVIQSLKYEKYLDRVKELKEDADLKILDKKFKF